MRSAHAFQCFACALTLLATPPLLAQTPIEPALVSPDDSAQAPTQSTPKTAPALPDSPGWTLPAPPPPLHPCPLEDKASPITPPGLFSSSLHREPSTRAQSSQALTSYSASAPCIQVNPYQRFLNNTSPIPLTPRQKGYLALHNFAQPGNLITIVGTAAFTIGANPHTAYGPGFAGFARNTGYSLSQDATGEFFGTFLIPSVLHEDPHYHREPKASIQRRVFHAISRTVIAQHDDGTIMPNYAVLLTYPISAELSNLYVPGIHHNTESTVKRIATGLATDPIGNIITEFLPDIARHVNIRVIFVQRILNAVTAGNVSSGGSGS